MSEQCAAGALNLFVEFLHHNPASGTGGDAEMMLQNYVTTARFYNQTFGEDCFAMDPEGTAANWHEFFA